MTAIVIFALVALFIGLRLYSVLGERGGHEQQPILKPAEQDARIEPVTVTPSVSPQSPADSDELSYLPTAGPGVRALLAADIVGAFRGAFLGIACFSIAAMLLAWSLPMRRL